MKLYYCPWACSLAAHIVLTEVGEPFDSESVDLKKKVTASGGDFNQVTPKGYVPALVLNDGEVVTENVAVLYYLSTLYPAYGFDHALGRTRLLEVLSLVATEIHKGFKPFWHGGSEEEKAAASVRLTALFRQIEAGMEGDYLFDARPTVADLYVFVMTLWAARFGVDIPERLVALRRRIGEREGVKATLRAEGMVMPKDMREES
ncbi:glutathione binding-like protein [Novosphingobium sp. BL-8A]|uniref:glutathione binding-like protein n=1 Tax=Novosphingobium sp. BL-8A TaxID=3127639 RepID=UPI0037582FB6